MSTGSTTIIFHERYLEDYPTASVECPARIESILPALADLSKHTPEPVLEEDVLRIHTPIHYNAIKRDGDLYEVAMLSAGGAVAASEMGMEARHVFALIRPPGHHASPQSSWGFCFFNNMAIAVERLVMADRIEKALILDIDLHFGDGTDNYFHGDSKVTVWNVEDHDPGRFVDSVERALSETVYDIVAVSAGFDTYEKDWGGILSTEDFHNIGKMVNGAAEANCGGRKFALLEGGYYLPDLGENVRAFIDGMEGKR